MPKKKKTEKQSEPAHLITFEIRKFVRAPNIVEAFNMDVQTPPSYIVQTEDHKEETRQINSIGFTNER